MNYNKEMASEFKKIGISFEVKKISNEKKGNYVDWNRLETKIACRTRENEIMLTQSELNAARSALC
jgi:hypothetical protein